MAKIKLDLPTGVVDEKSLLNAFSVNDNSYVILDAENVGSMGLPIILVSKYVEKRLIKITDVQEWTNVKGYLKEIISGINKEYITLPETLNADEIYYTQLTLPVASFDILKSSYVPKKDSVEEVSNISDDAMANVEQVETAAVHEGVVIENNSDTLSAIANPILADIPSYGEQNISDVNLNVSENDFGSINDNGVQNEGSVGLQQNDDNVMSGNPSIDEDIVNKSDDEPVISNFQNPLEETIIQNDVPIDYATDKEAFLAACANMFDALVSKFEAKNK